MMDIKMKKSVAELGHKGRLKIDVDVVKCQTFDRRVPGSIPDLGMGIYKSP